MYNYNSYNTDTEFTEIASSVLINSSSLLIRSKMCLPIQKYNRIFIWLISYVLVRLRNCVLFESSIFVNRWLKKWHKAKFDICSLTAQKKLYVTNVQSYVYRSWLQCLPTCQTPLICFTTNLTRMNVLRGYCISFMNSVFKSKAIISFYCKA